MTVLGVVKMHDKVLLPEPVTPVGDSVHDVLLLARLTRPAKPCSGIIVIVDVPGDPVATLTVVGLALMVKSWTV